MPRERVAVVAAVVAMALGVLECRVWTCDQAGLGAQNVAPCFCFIVFYI